MHIQNCKPLVHISLALSFLLVIFACAEIRADTPVSTERQRFSFADVHRRAPFVVGQRLHGIYDLGERPDRVDPISMVISRVRCLLVKT